MHIFTLFILQNIFTNCERKTSVNSSTNINKQTVKCQGKRKLNCQIFDHGRGKIESWGWGKSKSRGWGIPLPRYSPSQHHSDLNIHLCHFTNHRPLVIVFTVTLYEASCVQFARTSQFVFSAEKRTLSDDGQSKEVVRRKSDLAARAGTNIIY